MTETIPSRDDHEPLREPLQLEHHGTISELKKFEHDGRYIVRVEPLTRSDDHKEFKRVLDTFEEVSGLHYAPYWDVIAQAHDEADQVSASLKNQKDEYTAMYRVTKRVEGVSFDDFLKNPDSSIPAREILKCMEGIVDYWINEYLEQKIFLPEVRPDQFMYGKVEGEISDKIYMVDLDNLLYDHVSVGDVLRGIVTPMLYLQDLKIKGVKIDVSGLVQKIQEFVSKPDFKYKKNNQVRDILEVIHTFDNNQH